VNVVLQPGAPEGDVAAYGPQSAISFRDLSGSGWAIGVMLQPAGSPAVVASTPVRSLVDGYVALDEPRLVAAVSTAMRRGGRRRHERAAAVVADWIRERLSAAGGPNRDGLLANALLRVLDALPGGSAADEPPKRVADLAADLGVSTRTLERVALAFTGFTPAALIRRRRLQYAADRLRREPDLDLASLAHEVGYADHAHLTRDFRGVLGFTPSAFREHR
jgi:AraC-like DNA-binding protein